MPSFNNLQVAASQVWGRELVMHWDRWHTSLVLHNLPNYVNCFLARLVRTRTKQIPLLLYSAFPWWLRLQETNLLRNYLKLSLSFQLSWPNYLRTRVKTLIMNFLRLVSQLWKQSLDAAQKKFLNISLIFSMPLLSSFLTTQTTFTRITKVRKKRKGSMSGVTLKMTKMMLRQQMIVAGRCVGELFTLLMRLSRLSPTSRDS